MYYASAIQDLINKITLGLLNPIIKLLFAIATVMFIWGVVNYVIGSQGDDTKLKKGKQTIIWGLVGMFVMASAFGIVNLLCDFFGITTMCVAHL